MTQIRIAALGVGHWHALFDAAYLRTLAGMADVKLVGVQDADTDLAAQRAREIGDPPVFSDYRDMLAKLRPDFVLALGRHDAMAASAHFLIDEGYPFLIEKPVGVNAEQLAPLVEKIAAKKAFAAVPLFQRYHPFVSIAQRMLGAGELGRISHFYFRSLRPSSARYVAWGSPWMLDKAAAGGGSLRNVGLHGIDLFTHLLGEPAEVSGAQVSSRALAQPVEDFATVLLRTPSGVVATIEVGNTFPGQGADGQWKLSGSAALLELKDGNVRCTSAAGARELAASAGEPLPAIALRDTLERWRKGAAPAASINDCYLAMRLVDRAYAIAAR